MIFYISVFFVGCFLGLLNATLETSLLKKIKDENLVFKKPIVRTLIFGIVFCLMTYILKDIGKSSYIFTMFFICYLIAMIDLKSLIIPNKLIIVMLIASGCFIILGFQSTSLVQALIGLLIGFAVLAVPYFMGVGIGGGDVKLLAVVGFCVGYMGVLYIMILVGLLTLLYMLIKFITLKVSLKVSLKDMVPMGPFITISFVLFILAQNIVVK